jgi:predicted ATPase
VEEAADAHWIDEVSESILADFRTVIPQTPSLVLSWGLATMIVERAAGNPLFAEEMARELAERGVLRGQYGTYVSAAEVGEVTVPATLQATIAARIDRLDPKAKRTLSAAAVIGSRFSLDLLKTLGIEPILEDLVVLNSSIR